MAKQTVVIRPVLDKETLTLEEAASFLGVCVCTLRKMCRESDQNAPAVPFRKAGRRYIFSKEALHEWLKGKAKNGKSGVF